MTKVIFNLKQDNITATAPPASPTSGFPCSTETIPGKISEPKAAYGNADKNRWVRRDILILSRATAGIALGRYVTIDIPRIIRNILISINFTLLS